MDGSIIASAARTTKIFPFAFNETLCCCQPSTTVLHTSLNTYISSSDEAVLSDLPAPCPSSNSQLELSPISSLSHSGNGHHSPRSKRGHDLLDTRMWSDWSPCPAPFASQLQLMDALSYDPPTFPFLADSRLAPDAGQLSHTPAHMQPPVHSIQPLVSEFFCTPGHHHTIPETEHDHHPSLTSNTLPPSSSFTRDVTNAIRHEKKRVPVVIYHPAEKRGPSRPRARRACAINIDGIWIDKEELSSAAERDENLIVVHECLWAKDGNPCDMWIVGSRSSVGAHVRKWHAHTHTEGRATCMWDGCKKKMTQGSMNRHVVTSHLEERFHCQGCEQTFSRRDVYGQHAEKEEMCKGVGAEVVYGTERRVIDMHEALQQEGALRYSG